MALGQSKTTFYGRNRILVWTAGIIIAVIFLASFMSRGDVVPVRTVNVQRATIRSVISTNGKIEPLHNFAAYAPTGTNVEKVLVKEGEHVKRGQLLVQLNDASARSDSARALAQVRTADAAGSAVKNGGNQEEVLTLSTDITKTQADRDATQRRLDALRKLQTQGSASPGEVKEAENQLARSNADLQLLQQKQKDRYSSPEVAQVEGHQQEATAAYLAAQNVLNQLNCERRLTALFIPFRCGRTIMFIPEIQYYKQQIFLKFWCAPSWMSPTWAGCKSDNHRVNLGCDAWPYLAGLSQYHSLQV